MRYSVNKARFAVEELQDETIVMDLVGGRLFLLEGAASLAWRRLGCGESFEDVAKAVYQRYGEASSVNFVNFVKLMCERGVLEEVAGDPHHHQQEDPWPQVLGDFTVSEYDDLSSIITMDPIHDVDSTRGWPFESSS